MFTTTVVLSMLKGAFKNTISFFWQYKWVIILGMIVGFLYLRGNHYEDKYRNETVAHSNSVLQHRQDINNIRLANEQALRVAQEKSAANYKALVEKTSLIQKEYSNREENINATITELNSVNDSLFKQIKSYTANSNTSGSEPMSDSSQAYRLQLTGELLQSCIAEQDYIAIEADRLNNSVKTLQEWGKEVIKQSVIKQSKGEKDE